MKKVSLFSAVVTAGLMFPLAAAAQQASATTAPATAATQSAQVEQRDGRRGDARGARALRPQLTDAQREAMRKLREEHSAAAEKTRTELRDLHGELSKALSAAQIDSGRVNELKGRIAQRQAADTAARIDQRARIAALLTPEQRQAMGERGVRMLDGGRRGPRGMRGAPGVRGGAGMRRGVIARGQGLRGHGMGGHRVIRGRDGRVWELRERGMRGPQGPEVRFRQGMPGGPGGLRVFRGPSGPGAPNVRGARGVRGQGVLRQRLGSEQELREQIRRLEAQIEELRKKIG